MKQLRCRLTTRGADVHDAQPHTADTAAPRGDDRLPAGSRHTWPRCGATTRGERQGRTCRASGSGFGGRCAIHGGLSVPAAWRGLSSRAHRRRRKFILISSGLDVITDVTSSARCRRRWSVWAIPEDLAALLPAGLLELGPEIGYIRAALELAGVRRDVARRWPQPLGFRVVRRLSQRGCIAFAVVSASRDVRRLARVRAPSDLVNSTGCRRIEAHEVQLSLQAAGKSLMPCAGSAPAARKSSAARKGAT